MNLADFNLLVANLSDFSAGVDLGAQAGRSFDLFDWTGVTPTGSFAVADDDILIAGTTAHDANLIGLGRILNEWTSSGNLASRVNNLKTGGGLSGGFALNASTVFDDGANDVLTSASGKDWFLFGNGDVLTDLSNTEAATFI